VNANYGDLSIVAYSASDDTLKAGETLDVTVYMRVNRSIQSDYSLSVHLLTQPLPEIDSIAQDDMQLGDFKYPTRAWIPYLPVSNDFQLRIPDDLKTSASYQLVAILWQDTPTDTIPVQESNLATISDGKITVLEDIAAPATEVGTIPMSAAYDFSGGFSLEGYQLAEEASAGDTIHVDFWWSSKADLNVELTQFLHWFNTDTEKYVIFDQTPFAGAFPTQDWPAGLLAHDSWEITLPDDMPPGTYRVETGMFGVESQERVPVVDAEGNRVQDDSIVLGTVKVDGK